MFLINQYSKIGNNTYWVIPKGHAEAGETPLETALRELKEETGMTPERVLDQPTFDLHYVFPYNNDQIEKTVIFFIGIITNAEVVLDQREVKEAGWFPFETAIDRLDYKDTKAVFAEAVAFIIKELS